MAKRTRHAGRPSGRRPGARRVARQTAAPIPREIERINDEGMPEIPTGALPVARTAGLTEGELERAAELEAELNARERAEAAESVQRRGRGRAAESRYPGDVNAPLSVRAAHEYAYVARDVRRIILTGGLMVAILIVLDILVNVMGVITL
jgi:hypothetical protein